MKETRDRFRMRIHKWLTDLDGPPEIAKQITSICPQLRFKVKVTTADVSSNYFIKQNSSCLKEKKKESWSASVNIRQGRLPDRNITWGKQGHFIMIRVNSSWRHNRPKCTHTQWQSSKVDRAKMDNIEKKKRQIHNPSWKLEILTLQFGKLNNWEKALPKEAKGR